MLKQLFEAIARLFGALTTSSKEDRETTPPPPKKEGMFSDSADLPRDTVIIEDELPFEIEPGVVIPIDEEEGDVADNTGDTTTDETTGTETGDESADAEEPVVEPEPAHEARFMWCLDNGHGEETAGKRSPEFEMDGITVQFFEYEFNRDIVGRMIAGLRERGVQFTNIVPEMEDITLQERTIRANRIHRSGGLPVIYVSVHSNAADPAPGSNWTTAHGIETWHHKNSPNGKKIAAIFQKHLIQATGWRNRKLKTTALRNLYVLNETAMPAILTENGFFNNKAEVKKLMRDDVRQAIADAHIAAIWEIERNGLV